MPTAPTPVTTAPTVPDRANRSTFANDATNYATWEKDHLVPEINALAENVYDNAGEAAASATTATTKATEASASAASAAAAANVSKWVSGQNYTEGTNVWSPTDFQTYRRTVTGAGTTDPSQDTTNWERITSTKSALIKVTPASAAGAVTLNRQLGNLFALTLTENITAVTVENIPAAADEMIVTLAYSGPYTLTRPSSWNTGGVNAFQAFTPYDGLGDILRLVTQDTGAGMTIMEHQRGVPVSATPMRFWVSNLSGTTGLADDYSGVVVDSAGAIYTVQPGTVSPGLVKRGRDASVSWQKKIGNVQHFQAKALPAGGVVMRGYYTGFQRTGLLKLAAGGTFQAFAKAGAYTTTPSNQNNFPGMLHVTADAVYVAELLQNGTWQTGVSAVLYKLDLALALQWKSGVYQAAGHCLGCPAVTADAAGNVYFGFSHSENSGHTLQKYSAAGVKQWGYRFTGGSTNPGIVGIFVDATTNRAMTVLHESGYNVAWSLGTPGTCDWYRSGIASGETVVCAKQVGDTVWCATQGGYVFGQKFDGSVVNGFRITRSGLTLKALDRDQWGNWFFVFTDGAAQEVVVVPWDVANYYGTYAGTYTLAAYVPGGSLTTPGGALSAEVTTTATPAQTFTADGDPTAATAYTYTKTSVL